MRAGSAGAAMGVAAAAVWVAAAAGPRGRAAEPTTAPRETPVASAAPRETQRPTLGAAWGQAVRAGVVWHAPERQAETPPLQPLTKSELLAKAGAKDGDTTYTRLLEEVFDLLADVPDATKAQLRDIARKRQSRLKAKLFDHPDLGNQQGLTDEDDLSPVERQLLGERSYAMYRAKMAETFRQ